MATIKYLDSTTTRVTHNEMEASNGGFCSSIFKRRSRDVVPPRLSGDPEYVGPSVGVPSVKYLAPEHMANGPIQAHSVITEIVLPMTHLVHDWETELGALTRLCGPAYPRDGLMALRGMIHLRFNSFDKAEGCFGRGMDDNEADAYYGMAELYRHAKVRFAWFKALVCSQLGFWDRLKILIFWVSASQLLAATFERMALERGSNAARQNGKG